MAHSDLDSDATTGDEWTDKNILEDATRASARLETLADQGTTYDGPADADPLTTLSDAALCVQDPDVEATYRKRVIDHVVRRFDTANATVELVADDDPQQPIYARVESETLVARVPINQREQEPNRQAAKVRRKQPTTPGNSVVLLYREPAADAVEQTIATIATEAATAGMVDLLA